MSDEEELLNNDVGLEYIIVEPITSIVPVRNCLQSKVQW